MDLFHYNEIDSTNFEARKLLEADKITSKSLILADKQTNAQGSRGRDWSSDKSGNLLATYVFPITSYWKIPHLALYPISLSIAQILEKYLPKAHVQIKWPNDILVNKHKISGSLHEIFSNNKNSYFIAGIGINMAWHPENDNLFQPTSMRQLNTAFNISPKHLALELGDYIEQNIQILNLEGFHKILKEIYPLLYQFQREIHVHLDRDKKNKIIGIFKDIDEYGALCLETKNGIKKIMTADIFSSLTDCENKLSS